MVGKFGMSVTIKSDVDIHVMIAVVLVVVVVVVVVVMVVVVVVEPATGELWSAAASWCTLGHTQAQAPHTVNRDSIEKFATGIRRN